MGFFETGFMIADRIVKGVEEVKNLKLSKKVLLRAYYFEIITNLELLNVINMEAVKKLSINSPSVYSLFQNLEIQIGASIVFSDDNIPREVFDFLYRKGSIKETNDEACKAAQKSKTTNKTVLQAIDFTLRKITVLQKLASFREETDEKVIDTLRLKIRVENIIEHLEFIKKNLLELNKTENYII